VITPGDARRELVEARYGKLGVRVTGTDVIGTAAADDAEAVVLAAVERRGEANVMLATGNSQLSFLASLTSRAAVDWSRVRLFHMDEYVALPPDHPAGFGKYIRERVVEQLATPALAAHYIAQTASTEEAEAECARYAALLQRHPLDLCVMGIGENGHLAFNDPGVADFADPLDLKVVALDEACRRQQVGEGHFAGLDDVPTSAITVTIPALLRAANVIVVCPEARKAPAVHRALTGPVETSCPASILRQQAHARLYLDAESASLLG
jgi:glucosamine-6-phosphate deaminase